MAAHLGARGSAAFGKAAGNSQGLRGGTEFLPWMLDGASAATTTQVLGGLPPPARLLYRALWRRRCARTSRWTAASSRAAAERKPS